MTVKDIIALIAEKLLDTSAFALVTDASRWGHTVKTTPMAVVGFAGASNADDSFSSLQEEIYTVIVASNTANETEDIYDLIDTARDTIHAVAAADIWPFAWVSTKRIETDPGVLAYEISFQTQRTIESVDAV